MTAHPFGPPTTHTLPQSATAPGRAVADAFPAVSCLAAEDSAWEILCDPQAPDAALRRACRILIDTTKIAARRAAAQDTLRHLDGLATFDERD